MTPKQARRARRVAAVLAVVSVAWGLAALWFWALVGMSDAIGSAHGATVAVTLAVALFLMVASE